PGQPERDRRLPDRRAQVGAERDRRQGVRRLRAGLSGSEGARHLRLHHDLGRAGVVRPAQPFNPVLVLLAALCALFLVLPLVGGVALLLPFGRRGLIGEPIATVTGFSLPFTTPGVIVAEAFVAMPFMVITVEAGLRSMDVRFEEAARTLGARRWTVFRRVTLPLIGPSLAAGAVLAWSRALGEFGAASIF